ncbi:MAG: alginate export family protein [Exilibacterium sp.]
MLTPLEYWLPPEQSEVAIVRSAKHWQQQTQSDGIGNESAALALIHRAFTHKTAPGIRSGDKRPAEQLTVEVFRRPLTLSGEVEFTVTHKRNFSLGSTAEDSSDQGNDDEGIVDAEIVDEDNADEFGFDEDNGDDDNGNDDSTIEDNSLSVELYYPLSNTASVFASATGNHTVTYLAGDKRSSDWELELDQFWFAIDELFDSDFDFRLGKQYFYDDRQWWWDTVLDSVSISYWGDSISFELAVGEDMIVLSNRESSLNPEDKDILSVLGQLDWQVLDDHTLSLFFISKKDHSTTERPDAVIAPDKEDAVDMDLRWFGLRASGYWDTDWGFFNYWVDTARVRGKETVIDFEAEELGNLMVAMDSETFTVDGWALDLGLTWEADLSWNPFLTLSYAIGSGTSDAEEYRDNSFRQSGMQSNINTYNDINYILYYGELLDPELSNLRIATLAAGMPLLDNSSLQIAYHKYAQYKPADFLRSAALDSYPSGEDSDIGEEMDLIIGLEEWVHWELEFIAAVFKAGDAYDLSSDELVKSIYFKINYNF